MKVRQVWDGGLRGRRPNRLDTVRSDISIPSLINYPWILGAPQSGLALAILITSFLMSGSIDGLPCLPR